MQEGPKFRARPDDQCFRRVYGVGIRCKEVVVKDTKRSEIAELALFRDCRPADVEWIAGVADTLDVPAGCTLARQGSTVREFVVVVRGTLAASDGDGEVLLAPGSHFGETGIIDGRPHARQVETLTPARVLVFETRAFRGMLDRIPSVGRKVLAGMVAPLRGADQTARSLRAVS